MNICVFGVGGVGGYFGALLSKKFIDTHNIFFIARGNHRLAILKNGLTLKNGQELINVCPKLCLDSTENLPVCDVIILSVKSYDLKNASIQIKKISDKNTIILPLLNGIDINERIRNHNVKGIILPSCVYIAAHIESPGIVSHNGGNCKIILGKDPEHPVIYPEELLSLLTKSSIVYDWVNDIRIPIWSKYIFVASFALVTASYRKTIGEILEDKELCIIVWLIMDEIVQLAHYQQIPLDNDIIEKSFSMASNFPFDTKTSFQRDFETEDKPNELELFAGTILQKAADFGLSATVTKRLFERLNNRR